MNINNNTSTIANTFEISVHYLDIISRFMVLFSNITYFIIIFSCNENELKIRKR